MILEDIRLYDSEGIENLITELLKSKSIKEVKLKRSGKDIENEFVLSSPRIEIIKFSDWIFHNKITKGNL